MELDFSPLRSRLWEDGIEQIGFSDLHGIVPERYAALPYGVTLVFRLCSGVVDEVEVRSKPTFTYFQHYRAVNAALDKAAPVSYTHLAIAHIEKYSTGHSEAIITEDYSAARRFEQEIDSAAVYVNASTRFTDGGEFGLGAEIGISTQKLHARGPMGLEQLTSVKYIIEGNGQIR